MNSLKEVSFITSYRDIRCIDKKKMDSFMIENSPKGIYYEPRSPKLIISLTSYPQRISDIHYCLYSLLDQVLQPDEVILWLGEEQFPNRENDLTASVLLLREYGLKINWCKDVGPYKKLVPSLSNFRDDIIVTADDDIYYPPEWLGRLYAEYNEAPQYIHCHRAHRILVQNGEVQKYDSWEKAISGDYYLPSFKNFATGAGGVLYPPNRLHHDVIKDELFMQLSPSSDDLWFWAMAVLGNTKINVVKNNIGSLIYINPIRELRLGDQKTLSQLNVIDGGNDRQLLSILRRYKELDVVRDDQKFKVIEGIKPQLPHIIHIVLITDNAYVDATCVAITSMIRSKMQQTKYEIHVLAVDLTKKNISRLRQLTSDNINIEIIEMPSKYNEFSSDHTYVTPTSLYKFELGSVLIDLNKVLYLDSDILVNHDLSELYGIDIDGVYACVVKDMQVIIAWRHHERIGLETYFNSGVMLLNLEAMRFKHISESLLKYKKEKFNLFMDQDAFNAVFCGQVRYISCKYNFMLTNLDFPKNDIQQFYDVDRKEILDIFNDPYILHLTNFKKPWNNKDAPFYLSWQFMKMLFDDLYGRLKTGVIDIDLENEDVLLSLSRLISLEYDIELLRKIIFHVDVINLQYRKANVDVLAQQAELKAQQAELKAQQAELKAQQAELKAQQAELKLKSILLSRSWRITKPLRLFGMFARWFVRGSTSWLTFKPQSRPRRALKQLLIKTKEKLHNHKSAKNLILIFFKPFPKLKERLSRVGKTHPATVPINTGYQLFCPDELSPRAKKIYKELKNAIDKKEI